MIACFAYGSNMSLAPTLARCPAAVPVGRARLAGWSFQISVDGYAAIVPAAGGCVHGVLWRLSPRDVAALDAYECLHAGLYHRRWLPVRYGRRLVRALAYLPRNDRRGRPRPGQLALILAAAAHWDLPARYRAELARWRPGRQERRHKPARSRP